MYLNSSCTELTLLLCVLTECISLTLQQSA